MALASMAVGLIASWMVLDRAVLGTVPTGELLAVIAIAVLPLVSLLFLRSAHSAARRDDPTQTHRRRADPPQAASTSVDPPRAAPGEPARRLGAWGRGERDSRPRTHAGSPGRESVRH